MPDKVMKPVNQTRGGDSAKQSNTSIIKGPTASTDNLTPYNRSNGSKKK